MSFNKCVHPLSTPSSCLHNISITHWPPRKERGWWKTWRWGEIRHWRCLKLLVHSNKKRNPTFWGIHFIFILKPLRTTHGCEACNRGGAHPLPTLAVLQVTPPPRLQEATYLLSALIEHLSVLELLWNKLI